MNQQNGQNNILEKWNEFCKMNDEMGKEKHKLEKEMDTKKRKIMEEIIIEKRKMNEEIAIKKQRMMDEIMKEISENYEENNKLKKEIWSLKMKMAKIHANLKAQNISILHQGFPSELVNELFSSLPLESAFSLLTKLPNVLLVKNVQKMINVIKEANKLNFEDCGPRLKISENEFIVKHSEPDRWNSVQTILPIPFFNLTLKPIISFYFELQILKKLSGICIGFCTKQFPLEDKRLGIDEKNSIGFGRKEESCLMDQL